MEYWSNGVVVKATRLAVALWHRRGGRPPDGTNHHSPVTGEYEYDDEDERLSCHYPIRPIFLPTVPNASNARSRWWSSCVAM
jgi:hypothetical protein